MTYKAGLCAPSQKSHILRLFRSHSPRIAGAEALHPGARLVLGCYLWDYGDKRPLPVESMERQCRAGLRWLQEGRIEGMIFLASCICDLGLESVEWTRRWIAEVGHREL